METQNESIAVTRDSLEEEELTAANGIAPIELYKKLLVIYLIENDLPNAKFLWKRIPQELKIDNELTVIWKMGQFLWKREFPNVYATIAEQDWSVEIKELVEKLQVYLRERLAKLIRDAYSVIKFEELSKLFGLPDETHVVSFATEQGWTIDFENKLVILPELPANKKTLETEITSEQLLHRLTNYVSFMEN